MILARLARLCCGQRERCRDDLGNGCPNLLIVGTDDLVLPLARILNQGFFLFVHTLPSRLGWMFSRIGGNLPLLVHCGDISLQHCGLLEDVHRTVCPGIGPSTGTEYSDDFSWELARSSSADAQRRFSISEWLLAIVALSAHDDEAVVLA